MTLDARRAALRERGAELITERGLQRHLAGLGHSYEPCRPEEITRSVVETWGQREEQRDGKLAALRSARLFGHGRP